MSTVQKQVPSFKGPGILSLPHGPQRAQLTMGESAYSYSLTTFSPSGKLVQIQYALAAVTKAPTALGIKATNGVVLATEKKMGSTLMEADSVSKICVLNKSAGVTYAGMGPDFRVLVQKGRCDCPRRCPAFPMLPARYR